MTYLIILNTGLYSVFYLIDYKHDTYIFLMKKIFQAVDEIYSENLSKINGNRK